MPKAKKFLKKATSAKTARASEKPKRKRYPPTPGVDRRKRANNPRTGSRYVSEEAKLKILDCIGPQSLEAKVIAQRTGLSLTLVSCVVKHHESIFVDKEATRAPREVDAFGKQTTGPRAFKYKLGKVALRHYEARQLAHTEGSISAAMGNPQRMERMPDKQVAAMLRGDPWDGSVGAGDGERQMNEASVEVLQ